MNMLRIASKTPAITWLAVLIGLLTHFQATAGGEESPFPVLTIGTQSFTNVTVSTRNHDYVFLLHAGGLVNLKVASLGPEDRAKLGYPAQLNSEENAWTGQVLVKAPMREARAFQENLATIVQDEGFALPKVDLSLNLLLAAGAVVLALFLFWSYCSSLICQKTGRPGGGLVWVPVLQLIPLLHAAGMSRWWFLAFFVPVLNLAAQIIWSIRIAKARGKGVFCTILLLVPLVNLLAFLYLAFSSGRGETGRGIAGQKIQMMTLETA